MTGDDADVMRASFERALSFLRAGDPSMAESICRNALASNPRDGNVLCLLGSTLIRRRRPEEAEEPLRRAIELYPEFARAHEELGTALAMQRKLDEAVASLRRALALEPESGSAHLKLGKALAALGRNDEADSAFEESFKRTPHREALARAADHHRRGRLREAEQIYRRVLRQDPHNVDALRLLAQIALRSKQFGDAEALLKRTVELAPDFMPAWNDLIQVYEEQDKFEEAIGIIRRAIELDPERAHLHCQLGNAFAKAGRHLEAVAAYRAALALRPEHFGSLEGLGHVLKTVGRQDEAVDAYRCSIQVNPAFGEAYWSMANLKTFRFEDAEVEAMEQQLENQKVTEVQRIHFCFALGKAYEDRSEFDRAFEHYRHGNALRRRHESYDPVQTEVIHDRIIEVFDAKLFAERAGQGHPDPAPILIVGLPRSGSTLIEQILASHSQVEGTHELPELSRVIRSLNDSRRDQLSYPEAVRETSPEQLEALGRDYLERARKHRKGLPYFTDKMPNNFPSIGFLQLILPNAKVIDARRHPLDSCMGSFKQLFAKGQPFTYDLVELGEYYLEYRRMMDHWHQVLPGRVLEVQYEELVADQERQTRRILEYCRLPWEDACLRFYETERPVRTASSEQVRQPIYTESLHTWRSYEAHLGPLIEVLEPLLRELPEPWQPVLRGIDS